MSKLGLSALVFLTVIMVALTIFGIRNCRGPVYSKTVYHPLTETRQNEVPMVFLPNYVLVGADTILHVENVEMSEGGKMYTLRYRESGKGPKTATLSMTTETVVFRHDETENEEIYKRISPIEAAKYSWRKLRVTLFVIPMIEDCFEEDCNGR